MAQQQNFFDRLDTLFAASQISGQTCTTNTTGSGVPQPTSRISEIPSRSVIQSVLYAQVEPLLESQISTFSGTRDEDVESWIRCVEQIATVHGASDSIEFFSATSKLQKRTRKWYKLNTTPVAED